MKRIFFMLLFAGFYSAASAQLNVELLHQLVGESQSEHGKQSDARDRQVEASANEEVNKTMMARLKDKYRDIQSRFKTLGLAIDAAQIGIQAYPLVADIAAQQAKVFELCKDDPLLTVLALQTEADLVEHSDRLLSFLYGLCLSAGDLNQMKPSDRKMLFSHVLTELRQIAGVSRGLAVTLGFSSRKKVLNKINPFSDFINTDKKMIDEILRKTKTITK